MNIFCKCSKKCLTAIAAMLLIFGFFLPSCGRKKEKIEDILVFSGGTIRGLTEYGKTLSDIEIPAKIGIELIGDEAFKDCTNLKSITIPDSVISIGYQAFKNCHNLQSIKGGEGLMGGMEGYNFVGCTNLKSIAINSKWYKSVNNCVIRTDDKTLVLGCSESIIPVDGSVTSIGQAAFKYCTELKSITIPYGIIGIGMWAFYNCTGLTSVTIANSVTSIDRDAFKGCTALDTVVIGNGITSIGREAFQDCKNLSKITIPDSVEYIGCCAFQNCTGLTSITIGGGVTSIDSFAFDSCKGLTNLHLPSSLKNIGEYAFYGCSGLFEVSFANSKGWYVTKTENGTDGTYVDLTEFFAPLAYLVYTYCDYYWYQKG